MIPIAPVCLILERAPKKPETTNIQKHKKEEISFADILQKEIEKEE